MSKDYENGSIPSAFQMLFICTKHRRNAIVDSSGWADNHQAGVKILHSGSLAPRVDALKQRPTLMQAIQ
jgi:hypothetical protein